MGYYTKHIITIDKDSTREKLMELRDLFPRALNIYDDGHLDDYNWNGGLGSKWYEIRDDLVEVSKEFGDIPFTVHCYGETREVYDLHCRNGVLEESDDSKQHFDDMVQEYVQDTDDVYPYLFGGVEEIPA